MASTVVHATAVLLWAAPAAAAAYTALPNPYNLADNAPTCSASQYFDISSLQCLACGAGGGVQSLAPTESGLSCRCANGVVTDVDGGSAVCTLCGANQAPSSDGTSCMPCGGSTLGLIDGECGCPADRALFETNGHGALLPAKECGSCGDSAYVNTATGRCVLCPALHQKSSAVGCVCAPGYLEKLHADAVWAGGLGGGGVSCMQAAAYASIQQYDTLSANILTLSDMLGGGATLQISSKAFEQLLIPAATECLVAVRASGTAAAEAAPRSQPLEVGNAACNAVANLCVAQLYAANAAACTVYSFLMAQSTLKAYPTPATLSWYKRLPWLEYDSAQVLSLTAEVPLQVALSGAASTLTYVVASYALNGTFLGMQPFVEQLQLCTGAAADTAAFLKVGSAMKVSCDLQLAPLLRRASPPVYYDLYLRTADDTLYPVPVKLLNLAANDDRSASNDRLVRRFFAADATTTRTGRATAPQAIRYIEEATLTVTLEPDLPSRILPPLLTIKYAQAPLVPSDVGDGSLAAAPGVKALPTTFRAQYTMDTDSASYGITIFFILAIICWGAFWFFLLYMQMRRNKGQVVDGPYLAGAVATLCRVFGDVFFCFLFGTAGWMLIIYKEQDDIYVMLPISEGPNMSSLAVVFREILIAVFVAKCVHIAELVYSQTKHDIFLIDWEQPRDSRDGDAESGGGARGGGSSSLRPAANTAAGADPSHGVSTWRTVFVANEWAQLQSARSISLEVSLVFLLFFQQGLGLEDFSRLTPAGTGAPGVPHDLFLRFALSSFLLIALALVQWLARWAIWDRFVQDRVWQFVDLLAVTNISCLLLQEHNYGYYLHGRSVHEHADTDMLQVNRNLKREEDGLCAKRGLLKDSDTQSFEIFISREIRERYDKAIRGAGQLAAARAGRSAQRDPRRRGFASSPEDLLLRQRETNEFLTAFVSGTLERETLRVREKEYWERLINLPPEIAPNTRESIFLADPAGSFKRLLLAGRQFDMVIFHAAVYALFDMRFQNTFVAIFATYVADLLVRGVRHHLAVRNIARKTLLDPRFLL